MQELFLPITKQSNSFFAKEPHLYQALLKYISHHWGTLWGGELDKEDQAGGHNFLPGLTVYNN